jgi:hypothetical protein
MTTTAKRKEPKAMKIYADANHVVHVENPRGMLGVMAPSNAEYVNALGIRELLAVLYSVKCAPFPLGGGEEVYREFLQRMNDGEFSEALAKAEALPLGELRLALIEKAGSGCNAPTDSYLKIAADIARGAERVHRY